MRPVKGNLVSQHKIIKGRIYSGTTTGRLSSTNPQLGQLGTYGAIYSGISDPMVVCSTFNQYKLTDGLHTYQGMCLPPKYTAKTYGYNIRNGVWMVLKMTLDTTYGRRNRWYHRWEYIEAIKVPNEYKVAALLLSST